MRCFLLFHEFDEYLEPTASIMFNGGPVRPVMMSTYRANHRLSLLFFPKFFLLETTRPTTFFAAADTTMFCRISYLSFFFFGTALVIWLSDCLLSSFRTKSMTFLLYFLFCARRLESVPTEGGLPVWSRTSLLELLSVWYCCCMLHCFFCVLMFFFSCFWCKAGCINYIYIYMYTVLWPDG